MKTLEEIIRKNCPRLEPLPTGVEPKLNKIGGVQAVLFDIYGTLFVSGSGDVGTAAATDTAEALTQALVVAGFEGELEAAGKIGKQMLKTEILEWHNAAKQSGTDYPEVEITRIWKKITDALRHTETLKASEPNVDQIQRLALEYECRVNPVFPMPESRTVLKQLKASGLKLGIVSNAQFYTPRLFSAFFGETVENCGFEAACCIWSYREMKAKPSKDLFPKALQYLQEQNGIEPADIVYVGNDMLNDIYTARKAGCRTVLFAGDKRSLRMRENDERCLAIEPDAVIISLPQLLEIL